MEMTLHAYVMSHLQCQLLNCNAEQDKARTLHA